VAAAGQTLEKLWSNSLPAGHRIGEGSPLFPKLEPK
jgi:hypothetical protein